MKRIEKTVFISYRRANFWTALAIYQDLHKNGYDVFFDYKSIPSGDFAQMITENIKYRAHFIVVLSPSALERCCEPDDWLRREIGTAVDHQRNIIPLMMEGFDFGSPATENALTGKLAQLKKYQAMSIPAEYFEDAMRKLRSDRFLNRPIEFVAHPASDVTRQITEEQQKAANEATLVNKEQLTSQEWFEKGYVTKDLEEKIRYYSMAIELDPTFPNSYNNRGVSYMELGKHKQAIQDYDKAVEINPKYLLAYYNRGTVRMDLGQHEQAIQDYDKAIEINPNFADAYYNKACSFALLGDEEKSIKFLSMALTIEGERYCEEIINDSDLESIRGSKNFTKLMAEACY